jgi:hypothetical protein
LSSSLGSGLTPPLVTHVCCCKRQIAVSIPPEYSFFSFLYQIMHSGSIVIVFL